MERFVEKSREPESPKPARSKIVAGVVAGTLLATAIAVNEIYDAYADSGSSSLDGKETEARSRNAVAALVAGLVAQKAYGGGTFDMDLRRTLFPGSKVTGETTAAAFRTYLPLLLGVDRAQGEMRDGLWKGRVEKPGRPWTFRQNSNGEYVIDRGSQMEYRLRLLVDQGKIQGFLRRHDGLNWAVSGAYAPDGRVHVDIGGAWTFSVALDGKATSVK